MREPKLLVPYAGPDASGDTIDVYFYLRPETNGVLTESVIMKTIVGNPRWKDLCRLVYLANYPGDFIQTRHVVEHHYRVKIHFARHGGSSFTPGMRRAFERKFGVSFQAERVLGAFAALDVLGLDAEELFAYRVEDPDMLICMGQNIKRYGDWWIVNYDIPALLHRNTFDTDIAVMIFRLSLPWSEFQTIVAAMSEHLVDVGILSGDVAPSRAFHHSKSPWEQLLDGIDYLWGVDVQDGGAEDDISFGAYMMSRGYSRDQLREVIRRPIVLYRDPAGAEREGNMLELSAGMTYGEAEAAWNRVVGPMDLKLGVAPTGS